MTVKERLSAPQRAVLVILGDGAAEVHTSRAWHSPEVSVSATMGRVIRCTFNCIWHLHRMGLVAQAGMKYVITDQGREAIR